jgi:hypothetical protein
VVARARQNVNSYEANAWAWFESVGEAVVALAVVALAAAAAVAEHAVAELEKAVEAAVESSVRAAVELAAEDPALEQPEAARI